MPMLKLSSSSSSSKKSSSSSSAVKALLSSHKQHVNQIIRRKKGQQRQQNWKVQPIVLNDADIGTEIAPFLSTTTTIAIRLNRQRFNRSSNNCTLQNPPKSFESYINQRNQQIRILKRFQHYSISNNDDSTTFRAAIYSKTLSRNLKSFARSRASYEEHCNHSITLDPIQECNEREELHNEDDDSSKSSSSGWTSIGDGDSESCSSLDEESNHNNVVRSKSEVKYNTVSIDSLISRTNPKASTKKYGHQLRREHEEEEKQNDGGSSCSSGYCDSCDALGDEYNSKSSRNDDDNSTASTSDNSSCSIESDDKNSFPSTDAIGSKTGSIKRNLGDVRSQEKLQKIKPRHLSLFQCLIDSEQISIIPKKEKNACPEKYTDPLSPLEINSQGRRLFTVLPISEHRQLEAQLLYAQRKRQRYIREQEDIRRQKLLEKLKERQKQVQKQLLQIKDQQPKLFQQQYEALQQKEKEEREKMSQIDSQFATNFMRPNDYQLLKTHEMEKIQQTDGRKSKRIEQTTIIKKMPLNIRMKKKVKSMIEPFCNQIIPKKPCITKSLSSSSMQNEYDNKFCYHACYSFLQIREQAMPDKCSNIDSYLKSSNRNRHDNNISDSVAYIQKIEKYHHVIGNNGIPFLSISAIYHVLDESMEPHCLCLPNTYFLQNTGVDEGLNNNFKKLTTTKLKQKGKKPTSYIIYGRKPYCHPKLQNLENTHSGGVIENVDRSTRSKSNHTPSPVEEEFSNHHQNDNSMGIVEYDGYTYYPWLQIISAFDENDDSCLSSSAFIQIWNGQYFEDVAHEMSVTKSEVITNIRVNKNNSKFSKDSYTNHNNAQWIQMQGQKIKRKIQKSIIKNHEKNDNNKNQNKNNNNSLQVNRIEIIDQNGQHQRRDKQQQKENNINTNKNVLSTNKNNNKAGDEFESVMSLAIRRKFHSNEMNNQYDEMSSSPEMSDRDEHDISKNNNDNDDIHQRRNTGQHVDDAIQNAGGWDVIVQAGADPVIMMSITLIFEQLL